MNGITLAGVCGFLVLESPVCRHSRLSSFPEARCIVDYRSGGLFLSRLFKCAFQSVGFRGASLPHPGVPGLPGVHHCFRLVSFQGQDQSRGCSIHCFPLKRHFSLFLSGAKPETRPHSIAVHTRMFNTFLLRLCAFIM